MEFKNKIKVAKIVLKKDGLKGAVNLARNYYVMKREPDYVSARPLIVKIEPTIFCNLRCTHCDRTYWDKPNMAMDLEHFKIVIDKMPFIASINLQGLGEPTLNRDIFDMVKYAKSKGMEIGFFSNATLINDTIANKIVDSGLDYINISLDGASKEVYEKIRVGAKYEKVIENIKRLVAVRGNKEKPHISIWFVGLESNYHEIPGLIRLAKELGVNHVNIQSAHSWGKDYMQDKTIGINNAMSKALSILKEADKLAKELKIKLTYSTVFDTMQTERGCKAPWLTAYVSVDGYVTPCCMQASDPRVINFGNIYNSSFNEIWNSHGYKEFRKELRTGMPKVCVGCPGYYYNTG